MLCITNDDVIIVENQFWFEIIKHFMLNFKN